ncbi:hypothetical protein ACFFUT_17910 [Pseudohalocynthiibacter aestuariivivens]|jgi:hypothetical protein|uniref:Uncharacterized protein n=1 Tax=Pseudohalocynthiibacter aestuariivivens TaxID=1591409 RepID=A0ABV5JJP6_9RHOB|nr:MULTISPECIES: hypothetical protein [Pseudohalocynthiibacter]MBS9717553.1 hypothetical protein [Pseudohalocynthiibacter aestuariivivens]MCK0102737.1 hypothetical protein [Pseudohalocynthiibacter sp. F2068]
MTAFEKAKFMQTTKQLFPLDLWHGTSAHLLDSIKEFGLGGVNVVLQTKVLDFLEEAIKLVRFDPDEYTDPRHAILSIIRHAADQRVTAMNWRHGGVYVTGSKEKASSYAFRAPESFDFAKQILKNSAPDEVEVIRDLLGSYRELSNFIDKPVAPVLVKISQIPLEYIRAEHGGSAQELHQFLKALPKEIIKQQAFEMQTVISFDQLEIFEVSGDPDTREFSYSRL